MPWQPNSNRIVPTDWNSRKRAVHQRDRGICHECGHHNADEVDHLVNVAAGGTHELDNLALIHGDRCPTCGKRCHPDKTQREAADARARNRARLRHPRERHPGLD